MNNFLETQVERLINRLIENDQGFGWKNAPIRTFSGEYLKGEVFDYIIMTKQKIFCFDAKETEQTVWNILKKDKIQAINLNRTQNLEIDSFFLIYFIKSSQLMKCPINVFLQVLAEGRNHIKPSDCVSFKLTDFIDEAEKGDTNNDISNNRPTKSRKSTK